MNLAIYINAGHTPTGNPKRGWIITDCETGEFVDFVDEGYLGRAALKKEGYENIVETGRMDVSNSTYKECKALTKKYMAY